MISVFVAYPRFQKFVLGEYGFRKTFVHCAEFVQQGELGEGEHCDLDLAILRRRHWRREPTRANDPAKYQYSTHFLSIVLSLAVFVFDMNMIVVYLRVSLRIPCQPTFVREIIVHE